MQPLTPVSFLARTAYIWPSGPPSSTARRYTWKETYDRSRRLASALVKQGVGAATRSRPCSPTRPR
jgi:fatty-acyl-CoA synthase